MVEFEQMIDKYKRAADKYCYLLPVERGAACSIWDPEGAGSGYPYWDV